MPQVISSDMKDDHIFRLMGRGADEDPKGVFSINKLTGEVAVSRALDREAIAFYRLSLQVHSHLASSMMELSYHSGVAHLQLPQCS
ncbi:cadherin-13 [Tachysurus ichikawai]